MPRQHRSRSYARQIDALAPCLVQQEHTLPAHSPPVLQYKTQFAVSATGQLRLTALDAKANVQLLLKATGTARLTFGGTSVNITGAGGHSCVLQMAVQLGQLAGLCSAGRMCTAEPKGPPLPAPADIQVAAAPIISLHAKASLPARPNNRYPAGAATMQSKVLSVKLIAGDHPVKLEWMQASGASQVGAFQVAVISNESL